LPGGGFSNPPPSAILLRYLPFLGDNANLKLTARNKQKNKHKTMDKGAHFYRCDFQVHTPRDISWNGERPLTTDQRKVYADDFIKKCRES